MSIPSVAQPTHTDTEYRTHIPYQEITPFLNKKLTLAGQYPNQAAQFSLTELLSHLNAPKVILKGSAVQQLKNKQAPADIDFQLPLESSNIQNELTSNLLDFINKHNIAPSRNTQLPQKAWFNNISHQNKSTWEQLLICLGYPKSGSTQIDLCYLSKKNSAYDTVGASRTIHIDLKKQAATLVDQWHPTLVNWVKQHQLLWFSPDIENGLGRISYRLSKRPDAYLLQPNISNLFFENATPATVQNIYKRILRNEYKDTQLSWSERASLWTPLVETIDQKGPEELVFVSLKNDLKAWSKFNDIQRLKAALQTCDTQELLVTRLTSAYKTGLNFKESIDLVISQEDSANLRTTLQPIVDKALGAQIVPAEYLFKALDTIENIQEIPRQELRTLLSGCLTYYQEVGDDNVQQRTENTLGWLHGDPTATLLFFLDRIPSSTQSNPSKHTLSPVLKSAVNLLQSNALVNSLESALPQLANIKLGENDWQALFPELFKCKTKGVLLNKNTPEALSLGFLQILAQHAAILTDNIFQTASSTNSSETSKTKAFYKDLIKFCSRIKPQNLPPLLSNIIQIRPNEVQIHLPDMRLEVKLNPSMLTIRIGTIRKYITNHLFGILTPGIRTAQDELNIVWHDGCLFSGSVLPGSKNEQFEGVFISPVKHPMPQGLQGLINIGRALCLTHDPDYCYEEHQVKAHGSFCAPNLLKASNMLEAIKSMSKGLLLDESTLDKTLLIHRISNGYVESCELHAEAQGYSFVTTLKHDRQSHSTPQTEFSNAWGLTVGDVCPLSRIYFTRAAKKGGLTMRMHWNTLTRAFEGMAELTWIKNNTPFKWKSECRGNELQLKGLLFVGNNKTPVLSFAPQAPDQPIPIALIVLLGRWFTDELNGHYPFKPNVWGSRKEWPPQDFEGFIFEFKKNKHRFTGYKTEDGRAIGIWTDYSQNVHFNQAEEGNHYSLYTGMFLEKKHAELPEPISVFKPSAPPTALHLGQDRILVPHGLIQQNFANKADSTISYRIDWIYFQGEGISYSEIKQNKKIRYDSPSLAHHYHGLGYKDNTGKRRNIDLMLNPKNGKADFIFVRPEEFEQQKSYQAIYQDTQGLTQKLLLMNNEFRMGDITFPSGIKYAGEISVNNHKIELHGKFKITINGHLFAGKLSKHPELRIAELKTETDKTSKLLDILKTSYGIEHFTLTGLIAFVSGGGLSYESSIKPYLDLCDLDASIGNAQSTVFSLPITTTT